MGKPTIQTNFFPSNRLEMRLNRYELLEVTIDGEEKKRSKLDVVIPLSNKSVVGMPTWISDPLKEMSQDTSLTSRIKLDALCKGMTLEIFATEKMKRRTMMSTGVKVGNFSLAATGEGEKRQVVLEARIYVPGNITFHEWSWDHIHKAFYALFEYSQSEFEFDGKADEDEDEENNEELQTAADGAPDAVEDDDEYSAPAIAARARAKRTGPQPDSVN